MLHCVRLAEIGDEHMRQLLNLCCVIYLSDVSYSLEEKYCASQLNFQGQSLNDFFFCINCFYVLEFA